MRVAGVAAALLALLLAPSALAAPPTVSATATPAAGVAPLTVTLRATGDAAAYAWDFGDGSVGAGAEVTHVYGAGVFVATVTATGTTGEIAQAQVRVVAAERRLTLDAPRSADWGDAATFRGTVTGASRGAPVQIYRGRTHVATARVGAGGAFAARIRLRSPGPYHARYATGRSPERLVVLRPRLVAALPAAVAVGSKLTLKPRLVPAAAGTVSVGGDALSTAAPRRLRVVVATSPRPGWAAVRRVLTTQVVQPSLRRGATGPGVLALERRLAELGYALRGVDARFGHDTLEAVLAFQKVNRLPRTGRVDAALWRRLAAATTPRAARGGTYIEVDKTRQVLFLVRKGRVEKIVHVSTGATGNTPLGSWRVYRKVPGWDWVLWYPLYFKGGFAIHGYPSVPAYPASHGCVRVPMWIAPSIFRDHDYGTTVYVHL